MTIKEYEAKLREVSPDEFEGWRVIRLSRKTLIVTFRGSIAFIIDDIDELGFNAWVEPTIEFTRLLGTPYLDEQIKILQVTNEFIKSYVE